MWAVAAAELRQRPEWEDVQQVWQEGFKTPRTLPLGGHFFLRRRGGFVVAMCRVHKGELWDVCTREGWREHKHATAVCKAAVEWAAPKRLRAVTDCTWKAAWYGRMGCDVSI